MKPRMMACVALVFGCILTLNCSDRIGLAGATDMPNETATVSATVYSQPGVPAVGCVVIAAPSGFVAPLPGSSDKALYGTLTTLTDKYGHFSISGLDSGAYIIEINDQKASAFLIHCAIGRDSGKNDLGEIALQPYCTILGKADTSRTMGVCRYVQIYGLDRIVPIGADGNFSIDGLAPDSFMLRIISADSAMHAMDIGPVATYSGKTTTVYAPWKSSMKILLNTTASGAGIAGNLYGFPVLVRLNSGNFNFARAKTGGEDIRFTKPDNTALSFEIERWDAVRQQAEIWVKTDTVFGNDSSHFIIMNWENPAAIAASNGAAVFDTANGFVGVWHLNKNCNDATINKNQGTNYGASDTEGMIGNSKLFNGSDSIQISGLLGSPASASFSAWVQLDSGGAGGEIVSLGNAVMMRVDDSAANFGTKGSFHQSTTTSDTNFEQIASGRYLAKTGWHTVTFTLDDAKHIQTLFIDAAQCVQKTYNFPIDYGSEGTNTLIGKHGNGKTIYNFLGRIDEVRISKTALSADWIKLCYMNQKSTDMLVKFGYLH